MLKSHSELTMEELWQQEQRNFSGHLAIMFCYLQDKGLEVDDFIDYTGKKAAPRWNAIARNPPDMMNVILMNVLSNGQNVKEVDISDTDATATVTGLFNPDVMEYYGCSPAVYDRFWNKFIPIANEVGFDLSCNRINDGDYRIQLKKKNA
jgi:hypothetical protein